MNSKAPLRRSLFFAPRKTLHQITITDSKKGSEKKSEMKKTAEERKKERWRKVAQSAARVFITKFPEEKVRRLALEYYQKNHQVTGSFTKGVLSKEKIDEVVVNYIRHELSGYDAGRQRAKTLVGANAAHAIYKSVILTQIAQTYPSFKKECERQIETLPEKEKQIVKEIEIQNLRLASEMIEKFTKKGKLK